MKRFAVLFGLILAVLMGAATSASAATVTLTTMDFSQTRSSGHYTFVPSGGLHIWTDDATSLAKVAGYTPVSTTVASVAAGSDPSLVWSGTSPAPGFQLVGTNGGHPFILVGEAVYGDKWWISDAYCGTWCDALSPAPTFVGGGGSAHSATLDEWAHGMPSATITAIGFSLGSGVKGDGTITSLTAGGDTYKFAPPPVITTPPPTSTTPPVTTTPPSTTSTTAPDPGAPTTSTSPKGQPVAVTSTTSTTSDSDQVHRVPSGAVDAGGDGITNLAETGPKPWVGWGLGGAILAVFIGVGLILFNRRGRGSTHD